MFLDSVFGFNYSFPSCESNANAIILHNMASLYCLRKENDKAKNTLLQVSNIFYMYTVHLDYYVVLSFILKCWYKLIL